MIPLRVDIVRMRAAIFNVLLILVNFLAQLLLRTIATTSATRAVQ